MRAGIIMVALVALAAGCKAKTSTGPVPSLKASELVEQYKANEVGADIKYKGKRLKVAGFVAKVEKSVLDDLVVQFKEGGIRAEVDKADEAKVGALSPGQAVLLECTGRGMVLGVPMLGDCRVVKEGKAKG